MRTEKLYIGAHISQHWIDVAWLYKENYSYLPIRQFQNTAEGFEELTLFFFGQYDCQPREVLFCFESLGRYSLPLLAWLQEKGIPFTEGTPMSKARSKRLREEENYGAIARILTRYVFLHREEIQHGVFPAKALLELRTMLDFREALVKQKTNAHMTAQEVMETGTATSNDFIRANTRSLLTTLDGKIQQCETQLQNIINADAQLKAAAELSTSVSGVNTLIAAYMLVSTNCFSRFDNWRQFARYVGAVPMQMATLSKVGEPHKTSEPRPLFDPALKALLTEGARSAVTGEGDLHHYYNRRIADGKAEAAVLSAVQSKLISRVFATVRRGTPYQELRPSA